MMKRNICSDLWPHLRILSLADADELHMHFELVCPIELLRSVHEAYLSLVQQKEITLRLEMEENLKEIEADQERVVHILNNLLSNALRTQMQAEPSLWVLMRMSKISFFE